MKISRRTLIGAAATAATFHIVPRHVLGGPKFVAPSDKINLAIVGAGGRGRQVLKGMMQEPDVRVVAVADPATEFSLQDFYYRDEGGREPTRKMVEQFYGAQEAGFQCSTFEDFREMLAEKSDIDAILCGTPDHLHAYVSITAMRAGKHVYCEKPLTHNIWEARQVARVAKQTGLATQMGNQGHSTNGIRETCELLWSGAIGNVREVKAWVSGHRWNPTLTDKPTTSTAVPKGLNWDLWLGPRRERSFEPAYFPVAWRDFWAFGNSNIGDFACHDLDAACWALDLKDPTTIDFTPAGPCNAEIGPHGCLGYYEFPANEKRGSVRVTWYDGGLRPPVPVHWPDNTPLPSRGILFEGDEGSLFCGGAGGAPTLLGTSSAVPAKPEPSITRVASHARNWLDACKGGEPAGSNFGYGANLTEIALLGALSLRTGKRIEWNAQSMSVPELPEADAIIKEHYRADWTIS
ncbi:MAG: Gfo/Idh/MocA family oxidoreductase [Planctomycetales bacterium]|nr:Gfo/Idh/MocA family oxidoreductase [Planctomycetales bacterium]